MINKSLAYRTAACIDIHCEIQMMQFAQLSQMKLGESSSAFRKRVMAARKIKEERFLPFKGIHCNAQMTKAYAP
jgi:magnesium chelatase family protein